MAAYNPLEGEHQQLEGTVTLIIYGVSQKGHGLAKKLARQGSDVVIVDRRISSRSQLSQSIRQDVEALGQRCLLLGAEETDRAAFPQRAVQKIVETFGRLDAFVSLTPPPLPQDEENDRLRPSKPEIFDRYGLTKAVLGHLLMAEKD